MLEKKKEFKIRKFVPKKKVVFTVTPNKNILVGKRLLTARVTYHDITKTELTTLKKNKAI